MCKRYTLVFQYLVRFGRRPFLDRFLATKTKPTIDPTTTPGPSRPDAPMVSIPLPPLGPGCVNELGVTQ